ncbi:LrgB family protein [Paenalcaligenes faecalis]|uniref:LrgB family protein n=1 Tax=Paenalcaligenes faecalis TaxID=2980099 RepID=UPI0022B949D9|nr:LrgB family protein [Paenalcaligenes faecalis]
MIKEDLFRIWMFLTDSPLLWLTLTLCVYLLSLYIYRRSHSNPLLLPVLTSLCGMVGILVITKTPYETYFEGAQFIHFLIGPATVALAIPLYKQLPRLQELWRPLSITLVIGALTGLISSVLVTTWTGGSTEMIISLMPKSSTMPIAMAMSDYFGGQPSLTAVSVAFTGIIGSVMATPVFHLLRIEDPIVKGIATGISAHAIGTARVIQINETMGAFSALAMSVTGVLTAVFMPFVMQWARVMGWIN